MKGDRNDVYYGFITLMEAKKLPRLKSAFHNMIISLEIAKLPYWLCGEFCYSEFIESRISSVFDLLVCSSEKSLINTLPTFIYDDQLNCYSNSGRYNSEYSYTFRVFICSPDSELIPEKAAEAQAFGLSKLPLLPINKWVLHDKQRLDANLTGSERYILHSHFHAIIEKGLNLSEYSKEAIMDELNLSYGDGSKEQLKFGLSWAEVQKLKFKKQKEN